MYHPLRSHGTSPTHPTLSPDPRRSLRVLPGPRGRPCPTPACVLSAPRSVSRSSPRVPASGPGVALPRDAPAVSAHVRQGCRPPSVARAMLFASRVRGRATYRARVPGGRRFAADGRCARSSEVRPGRSCPFPPHDPTRAGLYLRMPRGAGVRGAGRVAPVLWEYLGTPGTWSAHLTVSGR